MDSEPNRLGALFREALHRHTGGHALFTVELLRGLQQRGDLVRDAEGRWMEGPALDWDLLPRRVEAVIAAHIVRLSREDQELLTVASVEGEEFHAEVAARVLHRNEEEVVTALSGALSQEHRLLGAQSLRRIGGQRFSRYRFRHYLFQHYLYQRLDAVRRAHLHEEVAGALEALGAAPPTPEVDTRTVMADDRTDVFAGPEWIASESTMAWHWEEAGLAEKASTYHGYAGRRAVYLSFGYEEILARFTRVLDVLSTMPESPRRIHWEQRSYHVIAWAQAMSKSWLAPEPGQAWQKALDLAERTGDGLLVADALTWLCMYHRQRGELDTALSLGERAATLAQGGLPGWVLWVEGELALTLLDRGDFARAARLLAPLSDALLKTSSVPPPPLNIERVVLMPWALWCLGYPDQALRVGRVSVELTLREKGKFQIGTEVLVLCNTILFPHRLRREVQGVEQGLVILRPLVEEQRCSPIYRPVVAMYEGWVHTHRGLPEQGIAEMRQALSDFSGNAMTMQPYYKGQIAEALARAGRVEEGLALLEEALEQVESTGERWSEAELYRLKGELPLQKGDDPEEVEACFRQAIAVAQGQEAKSWELRATASLARLLEHQGRAAEARRMLAAIYGWFTEGFDTPDLREAAALLKASAP